MNRKSLGATVAAISLSTLAIATPAGATPPASAGHSVKVTSDGTHVSLSQSTIAAGKTTFDISSSNPQSDILLFSLKPGVTMDQFIADMLDEFQLNPAAGTRELTRDVNFYGLGDTAGSTMRITEALPSGSYYVTDLFPAFSGGMPTFTHLSVTKSGHHNVAPQPRNTAVVTGTSADTFRVRGHIPAHGSFTFVNDSDTLHFVELTQVVPGTTDAEIQHFFDTAGPDQMPAFMVPGGGDLTSEVLSPGGSMKISTDLPAGTYVLLCWVADDETGMPHAMMGMHKVVTLR